MTTSRRRRSGMTLVEVLVAMGVLVIGMTGILALFTAAVSIQKEAAERNDVAVHISGVLAEVQEALNGEVSGAGDPAAALRALTGRTLPVPGDSRYRYRVTVEPDPTDPEGEVLLCRIELIGKSRGDDRVYDFGYVPVIPERGNDARIRELLGQ